jgi:outer membrane lipopolysaccharide assembly protein LptE/RlpB
MLKKILLLILILSTTSCGYETRYSKKNKVSYNFSINEINFEGDRDINLKIKEKLNNYTTSKQKRNFTLKVNSNSKKIVLVKNVKGDPVSFKSIATINVEILDKNKIRNTFKVEETFNYNNDNNKFNLTKYEKEIKNNLAETATNKLIFRLSSIQ